MNQINSILRYLPPSSAVWRFTPWAAGGRGPRGLVARLRDGRGLSVPRRLMGCFYCLSQWVSLPLAIWLSNGWVGLLAHWQELSGLTSLLERTIRRT